MRKVTEGMIVETCPQGSAHTIHNINDLHIPLKQNNTNKKTYYTLRQYFWDNGKKA